VVVVVVIQWMNKNCHSEYTVMVGSVFWGRFWT